MMVASPLPLGEAGAIIQVLCCDPLKIVGRPIAGSGPNVIDAAITTPSGGCGGGQICLPVSQIKELGLFEQRRRVDIDALLRQMRLRHHGEG